MENMLANVSTMSKEEFRKFFNDNFDKISKTLYNDKDILNLLIKTMYDSL